MDLSQLKTVPMEISDLRKYLPPHCKAVLYNSLSPNDLDKHEAVVVLYESKIRGVQQGHYVVLLQNGKTVEYFSSLGRGPNDELQQLGLKGTPKFQQLLGKRYKYNKTPLQNQADYRVEDCGRWVIARCLLRKMTLRKFVQLFKSTPRTPDDKITFMSLLLAKFVENTQKHAKN